MEVQIGNSPSDLLDDVPDESSALAQVALGARNTGLNNASGSLLYFHNPGPNVSRMSIVCHKRMCFPPKEGSNAEILHEVRRGRFVRVGVCVHMVVSTYVALVGSDNQARTGGGFLCHF